MSLGRRRFEILILLVEVCHYYQKENLEQYDILLKPFHH